MFAGDNIVGCRLLAHPPERSLQIGLIVMKADRARVSGEPHASVEQPLPKLIILPAVLAKARVEESDLEQHVASHGNIACAEISMGESMAGLRLSIIQAFPPIAQPDPIERRM